MASRKKVVSPEQELRKTAEGFMEYFPKHISREMGELVAVWLMMRMGTDPEATYESACKDLLSWCFFDTSIHSIHEFEIKRKAQEEEATLTGE